MARMLSCSGCTLLAIFLLVNGFGFQSLSVSASRQLQQNASLSQCQVSSQNNQSMCVYNPLYASTIAAVPTTAPGMLYMKLAYVASTCYNISGQSDCTSGMYPYCSWDPLTSTCNVVAPDDTYAVLAACSNSTVNMSGSCFIADKLLNSNCANLSSCQVLDDGHCMPTSLLSTGANDSQALFLYSSYNTSVWGSCLGQMLLSSSPIQCWMYNQTSCGGMYCSWDAVHQLCTGNPAAISQSALLLFNDTFSTTLAQQIMDCASVTDSFDPNFNSNCLAVNATAYPVGNLSTVFAPYKDFDLNASPTPSSPPPPPPVPTPPPTPAPPTPKPPPAFVKALPNVNPAVVIAPVASVFGVIVLALLVTGLWQTRRDPLKYYVSTGSNKLQMPKMPVMPKFAFGTTSPGITTRVKTLEFNALPERGADGKPVSEGSGLLERRGGVDAPGQPSTSE